MNRIATTRHHSTRPLAVILPLLLTLPLAGCSSDSPAETTKLSDSQGSGSDTAEVRTDIVLTADASDDTSLPKTTCANAGTPGATAGCLEPMHPPEYYEAEASRYFDTLDTTADPDSMPNYSVLVARWEWPPWLLLTGYGKQDMIDTSKILKVGDPSTVPVRDCRFFETQPFARCYVVFEYEEGSCPIYEEFTFNDAGETTFIEAWSDLPGLRPHGSNDRWARAAGFARLSTRVPGLGSPTGTIALDTTWMTEAAESDPDLADLALRTTNWWSYWSEALGAADPDFFGQGCGW